MSRNRSYALMNCLFKSNSSATDGSVRNPEQARTLNSQDNNWLIVAKQLYSEAEPYMPGLFRTRKDLSRVYTKTDLLIRQIDLHSSRDIPITLMQSKQTSMDLLDTLHIKEKSNIKNHWRG